MKTLALFLLAATACELPLNGTGPDDLSIDGGLNTTATADAAGPDSPKPPNGDNVQVAVCHSLVNPNKWPAECPSASFIGDPSADHYFVKPPNNGCTAKVAPIECSTCDYTCDCLLRYLVLPSADACVCSQETIGGPLFLSGAGCP